MNRFVNRFIALALCVSLSISVLAGCGSTPSAPNTSDNDIISDVVLEDDVIVDTSSADTYLTDTYILDNLVLDDGIYECVISDEIISDAYVFEVVVGQTSEEEIRDQLPAEIDDYDIDWLRVISEFAVGTTIIVAVGIVGHATGESTYFVFGSPATVAKDALVAGAMAATTNVILNSVHDGGISEKAKKYAIEGFADGYMWGAIASVLKVAASNFLRPSELTFADGITRKIQLDGTVLDDAGNALGHAFYEKEGIYLLQDVAGNTAKEAAEQIPVRLFNSAGVEIAASTKDLTKLTTLPKNSILQLGRDTVAKTCRTDDLGHIYRTGNELLPNMSYTLNGYKYVTDDAGRIITGATKNLNLKSHSGRMLIADAKEVIGKGFQRSTDDRGHIFADMFGGDNTMANIVSMDSTLNQGDYKAMETAWKAALEAGETVEDVSISLSYTADSCRPDTINVIYKLGSEVYERVFINATP